RRPPPSFPTRRSSDLTGGVLSNSGALSAGGLITLIADTDVLRTAGTLSASGLTVRAGRSVTLNTGGSSAIGGDVTVVGGDATVRSEEHTSELQSPCNL